MAMTLILLGTGTSTGVPEVGCACYICKSDNPRDKRQRTSALLMTSKGKRVLIDCGPDFRQQALHVGLDRIDAVVLTHEHYDHVYGLDDLRTIAWREVLPIYGQERVLEAVRSRMHYVFSPNPYPGTPRLDLRAIASDEVVRIDDLEIRPIVVNHGKLPIYGYRFHEQGQEASADIVYITDMKTIAPEEWAKVEDCRLLVINALRYLREHPSHQNVLDVERYLADLSKPPLKTVLTHLSHHAPDYRRLTSLLPDHIRVGYDYMCMELSATGVENYPFETGREPYYLSTRVVQTAEEYADYRREERVRLLAESKEQGCAIDSAVLIASTPEGGELALSLYLGRDLYSSQETEIRQIVENAVGAVLRFHQVEEHDYERIFVLRQEASSEWGYTYSLHLRVNSERLILLREDPRADALSLRTAYNKGVDIDIIVVESLLTAHLSKALERIMPLGIASSLFRNK